MMGKYRSSAYDKRPEQEVEQYDNRTILQMDQYKSREEDQRFYESSDPGTDARTSAGQSAGQTGRQLI